MAMFGAFVDDSGSDTGSWLMVLAGLVSTQEQWKAFADEWQTTIDASPSIDYYKASEYVSLTKCFEGFSHDEADAKTLALAKVISRHAHYGVASLVLWEDFNKHVTPRTYPAGWRNRPTYRGYEHPYFICFADVVSLIVHEQVRRNQADKVVDFVFDKQGKLLRRALMEFELVKEEEEEPYCSILGQAIPGDDKVMLPLQAADLFAWQIRNKYRFTPDIMTRTARTLHESMQIISFANHPEGLEKLMDLRIGKPATLISGDEVLKDEE